MTSPDKTRLVAVLDSPTPYTTPILNALAADTDLHVIYLSESDRVSRFADSWGRKPRFGYSVARLRSVDVPSIGLHLKLTAGIARRLSRLRPDAVLLVSWNPSVVEPLLWSRWSGAAAVMWGESTRFSGLLRGRLSGWLRATTARLFDGFVTNGSEATAYLRELGVPPDRIVTSRLSAGIRVTGVARKGREDDAGVRFLFVGRLIPQKRAVELVEAFGQVGSALPNATLTIVGSGGLESEIRSASARVSGACYAGQREGLELADLYARSDVLVFPALREVWGIVVNEALAHGLFVITTDQVGSAFDLIDDETGIVLPAERLDLLPAALIDVGRRLDTSDDARRQRAAAVGDCTPERFAWDIECAVESALQVRSARMRSRRSASSRSLRSW